MARLSKISRENLSDSQREVLESIESGPRGAMGLVGPFGVYVRAPGVGQAAQAFGAAVRYATELAENVKEVAICTVGSFYRAKFEFAAHAVLAQKAGVGADIVEAIRVRGTPTFTDTGEAVAYEVAKSLTEKHRLADDCYQRAVSTLGEVQMVELVTTIGYYTSVSYTLNAFEIPLREGMEDPFPEV